MVFAGVGVRTFVSSQPRRKPQSLPGPAKLAQRAANDDAKVWRVEGRVTQQLPARRSSNRNAAAARRSELRFKERSDGSKAKFHFRLELRNLRTIAQKCVPRRQQGLEFSDAPLELYTPPIGREDSCAPPVTACLRLAYSWQHS